MRLIRSFSELSKKDVQLAGGKGASLGEMTQAGVLVPPGYVILSPAFERFIEETELVAEIDSVLHKVNHHEMESVERASETIQSLILNAEMPNDIRSEIKTHFKKLNTTFVAVRSSATVEDSSAAAWAGQLDSYLNTTEKTLLENVKKCWASLFTPRAIFYRFEKGLHQTKISVAVIIQKMVESELSGIAFSVHPVTQDYNQMIIEAGLGLGEAIVSGQITPDSYVLEKNPFGILNKTVSVQKKGIFRLEKGGNEWKEIDIKKGAAQKLSDAQIMKLGKLVLKIEEHYGFPVDVEWAMENGRVSITQSRPITTLGSSPAAREMKIPSGLKHRSFERYERGPIQTFISYEYAFRSLVNNPLMDGHPNLVVLQHQIYEAWEEKSSRPVVSNEDKIKEIIVYSLGKVDGYTDAVETFLKEETLNSNQAIEGLDLLNKIFLELYYGYIHFCIEYCVTDDAGLIKRIPEVRLRLSDFASRVWDAYDKILFFCEREYGLEKKKGDMCTSDEIKGLLRGNKKLLGYPFLEKRAIAFTVLDNRFTIFLDKEAEAIKTFLNAQDPLLRDIQIAREEGIFSGSIAYAGKAKGKVVKISEEDYGRYDLIFKGKTDYILVTPMTRPEIIPFIKRARAIVTDEGGISCHAAIISREMGVPCIIGTKFATQLLKDGDEVEVNADSGIVTFLKKDKQAKETIMEKLITREHSVFYDYVWNYDATQYTKPWVGYNLEHILLISEPNSHKVSGWYGKIELEKYINDITNEVKSNPAFFKRSKKEYLSGWKKLFPYISKKKKIESIPELREYFDNWIRWFGAMANIFTIVDAKDVSEKLQKESLRLREITQDYTDMEDEVYLAFMRAKYPQYESIMHILTPEEVFSLEKKPLSKKEIQTIQKRLKGFFIWQDKIYPLSEFEEVKQQYQLTLEEGPTEKTLQLKGQTAFAGKVKGKVRIIRTKADLSKFKKGEILVTEMTSPDYVPIMKRAAAVITNEGGTVCHAAIACRELQVPCIVGTKIATNVLKDGMEIEVDANNGVVRILRISQK